MAYLKLFRELWHYAGKDRWKVVAFIILHALAQLATLAQPLVFAQILNSFQKTQDQVLSTVIVWLGVWGGLFVWFNVFHRTANYFCYTVSYRIKQAFLNDYYAIVTALPLKWHTDHHSAARSTASIPPPRRCSVSALIITSISVFSCCSGAR